MELIVVTVSTSPSTGYSAKEGVRDPGARGCPLSRLPAQFQVVNWKRLLKRASVLVSVVLVAEALSKLIIGVLYVLIGNITGSVSPGALMFFVYEYWFFPQVLFSIASLTEVVRGLPHNPVMNWSEIVGYPAAILVAWYLVRRGEPVMPFGEG